MKVCKGLEAAAVGHQPAEMHFRFRCYRTPTTAAAWLSRRVGRQCLDDCDWLLDNAPHIEAVMVMALSPGLFNALVLGGGSLECHRAAFMFNAG